MLLRELETGDKVYSYNKNIIVKFSGKRGVLSTGILNGGYSENLKAMFNHDAKASAGMGCKLRANTYQEHMEIITRELGLNPENTTCMGTAADMENMAVVVEKFREISVTALVTAGIESNGGRVGDPASYHESNDKIEELKPGTINMMVMIDGNIPSRTLTRALVTATEAKTAAIQELIAGSCYSSGIATGSGTDGTIICSNLESESIMTNAGKHSKLGELIGVAVKKAVKEALYLQTGLSPEYQKSILRRFKRYGLNIENLWEGYIEKIKEYKEQSEEKFRRLQGFQKLDYIDYILRIDKDENLVAITSLYIHLLDQNDWELLSTRAIWEMGANLGENLCREIGVSFQFKAFTGESRLEVQEYLIGAFKEILVSAVIKHREE